MSGPVIAIDGPAGTGKSTTARAVARQLGWTYVDSGAFYRVAALIALRNELDLRREADRAGLRDRLAAARIEQEIIGGRLHTRLGSEDITRAIRSPIVTRLVARVADDPGLREIVNGGLRRRVGDKPAVVEGRDIGSIVFPDAWLKIYLDASLEERALRRAREMEPAERAMDPTVLASYAQSLAERDHADRNRDIAPLQMAPDAVVIDTSGIDVPTQIARILRLAASRPLDSPASGPVTL
ncbi:MAG TPA: (d)CMP kinase [Gemmatimonadota bacterium]|nr:(d)CMP kinase [Gemmatimonadota bacterium]